ncbi:MAG: tRNA preQ1(34) S-adenosylmethionine ribosyltransferase-isomerase QueA [Phycisphaerales bacterium]|nr:MAG: tRNA preQ1(34) S-adenosylmethionine ribosyltransferase-isomerase QueA [Phycisphaerales bacterium]
MRTEKLNYELPAELIAQRPLPVRSDSRLLVLNRFSGEISDSRFRRLGDFLLPGDCLVLNDTKVVPARFFARRFSGAALEGLFLEQSLDGVWTVYLKAARKVKPGERIYIEDRHQGHFCDAVLLDKADSGRCRLKPTVEADARTVLGAIGFPPLPPYIKRRKDPELASEDLLNYQTVYAQKAGAVAAPTAGLHFTQELIEKLKHAGVRFAFVTLHVGAGTFKPVGTDDLDDHRIHSEQYSIDAENAEIINRALIEAGRIIPVGTTSTRVIETVADGKPFRAVSGRTDLFIKPGYQFKITEAMVTNFHLPKSTLLALVAAFAGLEKTLAAYKHAIEKQYRFYSYGDAMFIVG